MAGKGKRLQPIGFSKELYPVVFKNKHYAISEFSIRAMERADVDEIKLVVNPDKQDIAKYYSNSRKNLSIYFYSSPSLPESCLHPINGLHDNDICVFGLPDTLFSPGDGYKKIIDHLLKTGSEICLGLFKVPNASKYDSVLFDNNNVVKKVLVKQNPPCSNYIWGIWGGKVHALKKLAEQIASQKNAEEKLLGVGFNTLVKKKLAKITCIVIGANYFDLGTIDAAIQANAVVNKFDF